MDFEIRKNRTPQGRKKLSAERVAYLQLMKQGYSNTEACRTVGVDPRTGRKWRNGRSAEQVRDALAATVQTLPRHLVRSVTWDQGSEMAAHHEFTAATDIPVYFCDPASPWQRGSNENTNGLLRQYFPKGTDLSVHSAGHLEAVAVQLNGRPRKTLGWDTPAERLAKLLPTSS
ncbi:IS30 family transposase [Nocardiopsis aegyptia]|uniref:IS30 family transposase n=1 Tax=Nocardiopsis aegyptia TaxID=220378 RepID=A0A7Z0JCV7_9ACTN|nr:IS30 family transposase [Nocardiopsis aegyptia]